MRKKLHLKGWSRQEINHAESAYEKIKAGNCLVQLYTGFIYQWPLFVKRINKELLSLIKNEGYLRISQAVGKQV